MKIHRDQNTVGIRGSGNTKHLVCIIDNQVILVNNEDPYYSQIFETKQEIDELIDCLNEAKKEVFK